MLDNLESLTIIICTILGTAFATVSTIFSLQKSFREHIKNLFEDYDKNLKIWIRESFEGYYIPLDERLKSHNLRIRKLEENK